jgi:hypothetical protein
MFGHQFYNQTIRRYIVAFGNMFNDLVVHRLNASGTPVQTIAVPIAYGPKEKFLVRIRQDPDLDQQVAIQLPRIGFELTGMMYDGTRRLTHTTRNVAAMANDKNKLKYQYVPVPYNIDMALSIFVKNADDGAQILEQIVPFFGPEWTNTINLIPDMGISMDVPTVLTSINIDDNYEGDFISRRALIYDLRFTMKGFFFGPISHSGIIKRTSVDLNVVTSANTEVDSGNGRPIAAVLNGIVPRISDEDIARTGRSERIVITPGLLANGQPTTNSSASINYRSINANTNYGICDDVFTYSDGLKYNPATGNDEVMSAQDPLTGNYDYS